MHHRSTRFQVKPFFVALLLAIIFASGAAQAERKMHLYKAQYRTAEELLPVVEAALGDSGSVTLDAGTNSLLLLGNAEAIALALQVLEQQDTKLRNIVIYSTQKRIQDLHAAGFDVRWSLEAGDFRIGNATPITSGSHVEVRVGEGASTQKLDFSSMVRVLEGNRAQISTGSTMPIHVHDHHHGHHGSHHGTTAFISAASGFDAKPRILGDGRVQIDINPYQEDMTPEGVVHTTGAVTTVTLKPGELLTIGGIDQTRSEKTTSITSGAAVAEARDEQVLLLRVEIE